MAVAGRARSLLQSALGFGSRTNVAAWLVAGGAAYWLFVVPERKRAQEEQQVRQLSRQLADERRLLQQELQGRGSKAAR